MATRAKNNSDNLDLTKNEFERIEKAMKDEHFVKLLSDYARELKDPENKARYEAEIAQMEAERGMSVAFINPKPGHVIKTRDLASNGKVFINICSDSNIGKPTSRVEKIPGRGQGLQWSIPYSLSQPRDDIDKSGEACKVFDVIYHEDSLYLGGRDLRMRELLHSTALDALETNHKVFCDRKDLKFPKMQFKGVSRPTMIRKPLVANDDLGELKEPPAQPPTLKEIMPELASNQKIIPKYTIKYRSSNNLEDHVIKPLDQVSSCRPKALILTISLPLLSSAQGVDLDVQERSLSMTREEEPKYDLHLDLPYPVDEEAGNAKFDKSTKSLIVTLPIKPAPQQKAERLSSNDSGIEEDTAYRTSSDDMSDDSVTNSSQVEACDVDVIPEKSDDNAYRTEKKEVDSFLDEKVYYSLPNFSYSVQDRVIVFTLDVKNVSPNSLGQKIIQDRLSFCLKFSSVGSGHVQIYHAFAIDFLKEGKEFSLEEVEVEIWDNNVVVQLPLDDEVESFKTGVSVLDLIEKLNPIIRDDKEEEGILQDKKSSSKKKNKYKQEKHPKVIPDEEKDSPYFLKNNKKERERHSSGESMDSHMSESPMEEIILTENDDNDLKTETESCDEDIQLIPPRFSRAVSVESAVAPSLRPRGILKRKSSGDSSIGRLRCFSESNMDDLGTCWSSATSLSENIILEGEEADFASQKKSVRFDEQIKQHLYRIGSSILANTAKNKRKAEKKKRALERRMSEGDTGSLDSRKGRSPSDFVKVKEASMDWTEGDVDDDSGLASSFEENLVLTDGNLAMKEKPAKGKKMTKRRTKQFQMSNELIFDLDI